MGDSLLSAGEDGLIRQWDLASGAHKRFLNGGVGPVTGLAFNGRKVAVCGRALAIRLRSGEFTNLVGHQGSVLCLTFSPDGNLLASGGIDGTVRLWSAQDGSELACLSGDSKPVKALAFGPDSATLYAGEESGTLRIWPVPVTAS
jgi:WD40 repeat protein